ncbi:MAG: NlpC/P60 family protein [Chloroflexota bacterium]|nr:NlpC/P60 family protein [Chloroflexota bacterium]
MRRYACNVYRLRQFRRCVVRSGASGLLFLLILLAAQSVAAAGTPGASQPVPATQPTIPPTIPTTPTETAQVAPTTVPSSGMVGRLNPPASPPTPPQEQVTPSSPTPPGTVSTMPLQSPTVEMPPTTATSGAASPTVQAPTVPPTATRPAETQTPIPTATSQPTTTPTGTPTGTPVVTPSPEEIVALAHLVLRDDPGIGGNMAIVHAAARHFGEQNRPDGVSWAGWCEMYISNVMDEAGIAHSRYATALLDAISGPLYRGRAPAGSVVYFDQRANPNGHVGIALGDGTMLSALDTGIVRSAYENWPSYLGWRPYGTTAPPDDTAVIAPLLTDTESDFPRMPAWP